MVPLEPEGLTEEKKVFLDEDDDTLYFKTQSVRNTDPTQAYN